jgi:hypothetical protein
MSYKNTLLIHIKQQKAAMRCQNNMHNNNHKRCIRTADKKIIIKDYNELGHQSTLWICRECFNEKMYEDQLFKDNLIQVVELNNKK